MKKIVSAIFAIFISTVLICSCKKGNDAQPYHISCSINGVPTTFNVDAYASLDSTDGNVSEMRIQGVAAKSETSTFFILDVTGRIVSGAYSDTSTTYWLDSEYGSLNQASPDSKIYRSGKQTQLAATANDIKVNGLKVQVTSINEHTVQGTFSGDYFLNGDVSTIPMQVTNGSFNVEVQ